MAEVFTVLLHRADDMEMTVFADGSRRISSSGTPVAHWGPPDIDQDPSRLVADRIDLMTGEWMPAPPPIPGHPGPFNSVREAR